MALLHKSVLQTLLDERIVVVCAVGSLHDRDMVVGVRFERFLHGDGAYFMIGLEGFNRGSDFTEEHLGRGLIARKIFTRPSKIFARLSIHLNRIYLI